MIISFGDNNKSLYLRFFVRVTSGSIDLWGPAVIGGKVLTKGTLTLYAEHWPGVVASWIMFHTARVNAAFVSSLPRQCDQFLRTPRREWWGARWELNGNLCWLSCQWPVEKWVYGFIQPYPSFSSTQQEQQGHKIGNLKWRSLTMVSDKCIFWP